MANIPFTLSLFFEGMGEAYSPISVSIMRRPECPDLESVWRMKHTEKFYIKLVKWTINAVENEAFTDQLNERKSGDDQKNPTAKVLVGLRTPMYQVWR